MTVRQLHHLSRRAFGTFKRFLAMFLYLYVALGVLTLHEYAVLKQHEIPFLHFGLALVNASILAKVMLVGEELHLGRGWEDRPLFYSILAKSLLFGVVLMAFYAAEKLLEGLWSGQSLADSIPALGGGGIDGLAVAGMTSFLILMPFFLVSELSRVIGREEFHALMFRRRGGASKEAPPAGAPVELPSTMTSRTKSGALG